MGANVDVVSIAFYCPDGQSVGALTLFAPSGRLDAITVLDEADPGLLSEERIQIFEATRYEYEIDPPTLQPKLVTGAGAFKPSANPNQRNCGALDLGAYVGRLRMVLVDDAGTETGFAAVEVCTRKIGYRDDLRAMIEEITEHAVELAFELRSPTTLRAVPDPSSDPKALYQQFAFLSALVGAKPFKDALHHITTRPHERLDAELVHKDLRRGFKPSGKSLREMARGTSRFPVPSTHPLRPLVASLPISTLVRSARRSEDNPENRFVRFALETFSQFLKSLVDRVEDSKAEEHVRLVRDAGKLLLELELSLSTSVLANASPMQRVPLESPVLQRKEGYREVLQAWLKFDLAARLVWEGGSDVYDLGRRDVATLYEYWVFFKLLDIFSDRFSLDADAVKDLIEETGDHLGLRLKTGRNVALRGHAMVGSVKVNARFDYNRTFVRHVAADKAGSWTQRMRPDYTLTLWLGELDESIAEANGEVVHVHFDAKYRVDDLEQIFGTDDWELSDEQSRQALDAEAKQQTIGVYKRADLLKMHAYRDAIRRSYGAYVLYPGSVGRQWTGFHELLPGVGAFVLRPGTGNTELSKFIEDLLGHVAADSVRREVAMYAAGRYSGVNSSVT